MGAETQVYVVMGNDFPDAVFATREAAEAYCAAKKAEQEEVRVYWRVYTFTLRS